MTMSEKVIYELLKTNAPLIAVVPVSRIYGGLIPIGATLPAIAYNHISTVEDTSISLTVQKVRSRVQVTVAAKTYPEIKSIAKLVKTACNNKQGTFNSVKTDSVILENVGADYRDDSAGIYYGTIDFRLAYDD
jgi:hypothetical protein